MAEKAKVGTRVMIDRVEHGCGGLSNRSAWTVFVLCLNFTGVN